MFGQPNKPAGFGASTGGGGFGTPAPATGGFGFGGAQPLQQQQAGQPQQPASSFGGFGVGTTAASPFGAAKPAAGASPFGGFGGAAPTTATTGGGLFGAAPAPGASPFGAPATGGGLFGAAPAPAPAASPFGAPAATGGGLFGSTAAPATGGFGGFGTGLAGAGATGGGLFGGAAPSPFGQPQQQQAPQMQQPMTAAQQQQQQLALQRRFWEHELDLIRDTYTPQSAQAPAAPQPTGLFGAPAAQQPQQAPRVAEYKFAFRVTDTSTGQPREVLLTDHKMVEAKLASQQAEMGKVKEHLETLGRSVKALDAQARGAKDRLAQCREAQMLLTNRFLVVLQRIQVMHSINRPFNAREKAMRDRLEAMVGRLEDAIRTLNEVGGVVDEEEASLRDQPRPELRCNLEPADLELLQQALEKQQQGLDYLTKTLKRDLDGVELLGERLDGARPTF